MARWSWSEIGLRNLISFLSIMGLTSFTNVSNVLELMRRKLNSFLRMRPTVALLDKELSLLSALV